MLICYYVKSRRSAQWFQWLQTQSKNRLQEALIVIHVGTIGVTCFVFNRHILELYYYLAKKKKHFHFH